MESNVIRGELLKKGFTLSDIARLEGESRALVWVAIRTKGQGRETKVARIRRRISQITGLKIQ